MNQTNFIEKHFPDKEKYSEFIKIISSIKTNPIVDAILFQVTRYHDNSGVHKGENLYIVTNTNSDYLGKVMHNDFFRNTHWIEKEISDLKSNKEIDNNSVIKELSLELNSFRDKEYSIYKEIVEKDKILLDKQVRKINDLDLDLAIKRTNTYNYVTGPTKDFTIDSYILFDRFKSLDIRTEEELMRGTMMALMR